MKQEKIDRINELAAIAKKRELTKEEFEERAVLRREYIDDFKKNLLGQLNNVTVLEPDGTKHPLRKKQ